jgi:glyoxylase-like metal-dependent hydrolase (beta-lactamase superfamily II)
MKWWLKVVLVIVVLLAVLGVYVFSQLRSLTVEQLTEDAYVIYGLGGNVGVLDTDEGTVIVDTMTLRYQGSRIREEAERLTGKPVVMIINTHYHLDHTHGNPAFEAGTRVLATERTLHHLQATDANYFSGAAAALLPNETFDDTRELTLGNKTILLFHTGRGHTDGDLVALFLEDGVLHAGDLYFNQLYPNIDLEAGGSVQQWGDTLERVRELPFNQAIPGHGPVSGRESLLQFQRFIRQLADIGRQAANEEWTREQAEKTLLLTEDQGYGEVRLIIPIGLNREFVLRRAWEEATGNFAVRE